MLCRIAFIAFPHFSHSVPFRSVLQSYAPATFAHLYFHCPTNSRPFLLLSSSSSVMYCVGTTITTTTTATTTSNTAVDVDDVVVVAAATED